MFGFSLSCARVFRISPGVDFGDVAPSNSRAEGFMALGKDELMAVALAMVGVAMSSTWSTVGLGMLEPIVRDMDYNSTAIPMSIWSIISAQLAQLDALQKRQAQKASAADENEMSSDSADTDPSDSVSDEEDNEYSSEDEDEGEGEDEDEDENEDEDEDEEQEVSSVSDRTSGLSSDCAMEVTSDVGGGQTSDRKRKRSSSSSSDDDEARLLRENTRKMLDIYREYTVAQKLHDEAQLELHQTTLATYKEVGMANAQAIGRVADAITELAAATARRLDGSNRN